VHAVPDGLSGTVLKRIFEGLPMQFWVYWGRRHFVHGVPGGQVQGHTWAFNVRTMHAGQVLFCRGGNRRDGVQRLPKEYLQQRQQ